MKMKALFIAGMVLFALFISAGCTDFNTGSTQSSQSGASAYGYGDLTSATSQLVQHYRSDSTCYYRADTVDIINNGAEDAQNVVVRCNLVDPATGKLLDTTSRYFEVIQAGDHQAFEVELNGECGKTYELEVKISKE